MQPAQSPGGQAPLELALDHIYNLEFGKARSLVEECLRQNPADLLALNYLANVILDEELLKEGLFATEDYGNKGEAFRERRVPVSTAFQAELLKSLQNAQSLADDRLKKNPRDKDALYWGGVAHATRSEYLFTPQRSNQAALREGLEARKYHLKLHKADPQYADVLLVIGIADYVAGSLPWYVKVLILTVLQWVVLIGALLPLAYYLVAISCAIGFFRSGDQAPAHLTPPVSILKPIRGLDREAYENFASFCRQHYPRYEILFGAADEQDPAIPIIRRLSRDFPDIPIRLLIGFEHLGSNDKVNKLCRLVREARHDLLVISDSDIRVRPDYLRRVVSPFVDRQVGVVTCMYMGAAEPRLWSALEAINLSSNFMPGVLVARQLEGVRFAMGATIAVTRERLREIGGFEALADFAADDFELGSRVAARGYRVDLSPYTVQTMCSSRTAEEFFERHLRWAIVVRTSRSRGHFGWVLTQGLPWSLAAVAAAHSSFFALGYLGAYLTLRLTMAWTVGVWGLRDELLRKKLWLVPLSDAVGFLIWLLSFGSNRITWRGSNFYVRKGRLVPVRPNQSVGAPGSCAVQKVDVANRD
jgi:ceramide glucosyltransferase